MENKNHSILILKNYIFNSRIIAKKDQNYEIWSGRIRTNNEKLKAYIFYTPLKKEIIKEINKWIILGKYEISADKAIRYLEFFIATSTIINNNEPISVLIIQISDHCITLETLLKTRLDIEDQIKYFNQLIKIFYSLHGSGLYHLNLSNNSILWDSISHNLKIYKDPIEIIYPRNKIQLKDEFKACGKLLRSLLNSEYKINIDKLNKKEIKLPYMIEIIELYENCQSEENIPSPKDIFNISNSFFEKIKEVYNNYNQNNKLSSNIQLVNLLSACRKIDVTLPTAVTSKNLLTKLHDILPSIPQKNLENQSPSVLKIVSALEGNIISSNISSIGIENILTHHGLIKDIYNYENTIELLKNIFKTSEFSITAINLGILEDYRVWYKDQYLFKDQTSEDRNNCMKIHNNIIMVIVKADKWFYDNINVNYEKLLIIEK